MEDCIRGVLRRVRANEAAVPKLSSSIVLGGNATRNSAILVAMCCAALSVTTTVTRLWEIDTNIDTGSRAAWLIVTIAGILGLLGFVVCAAAGLTRLTQQRGVRNVYGWWAVAIGSIAILVVVGSLS